MSIFVNANKNLALTLVTNVQVFIVEFVFKEDQNSNIVVAILNNIQQLGCIFVMSFCLRDFVQMASKEPLTNTLG